jgi:hypothetical protein
VSGSEDSEPDDPTGAKRGNNTQEEHYQYGRIYYLGDLTNLTWLTDKTLDLPGKRVGRKLTLMNADFLVLSAYDLRKSA